MDPRDEAAASRGERAQIAMDFCGGSGRTTPLSAREAPGGEYVRWTTEEIVRLHLVLLDDLRRLADAETPLEERFELLEGVCSDAAASRPFSFGACVRLFSRTCDPASVREAIRALARAGLAAALERYPAWLAERVLREPEWAAESLHRDPQWINQALARARREPDLFGDALVQ